MKDQKAILIKCIKNDVPAFVIAGHDLFAVPTLEAYYQVAKENGADTEFLKDMNLVVQEMKDFQHSSFASHWLLLPKGDNILLLQ